MHKGHKAPPFLLPWTLDNMISDQPKKNVIEREAFHELFNVESEADMKGGFLRLFS